jgi:hypothetical protein
VKQTIVTAFISICCLTSCTSTDSQDYFCESYVQEDLSKVYKQQIARLSEKQFCVMWPVDTQQCAQFGQPSMTEWMDIKETKRQMRGHLQLAVSKTHISLHILPFVRAQGDESNGIAVPTEQMHFVFRRDATALQLTPGNQDTQTIEFVCKSWVRQKWWSIY